MSELQNVGAFKLLPCGNGVCQECAVNHPPEAPHNNQSLFYQYRFFGLHGRFPTWKDAVEHCDEPTRRLWESELRRLGHWSEPAPADCQGAEP